LPNQPTVYSIKPHLVCLGLVLATVILFWSPVRAAVALGMDDYRYPEITAAPFLCGFLFYLDRKRIFSQVRYSPKIGLSLFGLATLVCFGLARWTSGWDPITRLFPLTLALIGAWLAAFISGYGLSSFQRALYPLGCLSLAAPLPPTVVDSIMTGFQNGSAAFSYGILQVFGVSVFRQGTVFSIPGLDFNIAPECSGIHSASAFLIVALLAGRLFLRSSWSRLALVLATIPIATFKNAVRIAVTTSLGAFVDRSFIDGPFHHQYGGIVFAPVDALLFIPLLLALQKIESRSSRTASVATVDCPAA
jgi:exosortase